MLNYNPHVFEKLKVGRGTCKEHSHNATFHSSCGFCKEVTLFLMSANKDALFILSAILNFLAPSKHRFYRQDFYVFNILSTLRWAL